MRWLRQGYRLAGFTLITSVLLVVRVAPMPILRLRDADRAWRDRIFRLWARTMCRIIGMRVHVVGQPPEPPCMLVTNHLGYVDIVLLASHLPAVFVSKAEVAGWPLMGAAAKSVGTVFIDRARHRDLYPAIEQIERALANGNGVVLFAEGTSSNGAAVLPMKPSLLQVPAAQGTPVHYAAISYATPEGEPAASEAVCWWNESPFFGHLLGLLRLTGFDARLHFGDEAIVESDRKRLAGRLHAAISSDFVECN